MKDVSLLIKPASGGCNLRCGYCFYTDEAEKREVPSYGIMPRETLRAIVRRALESAHGSCTFVFQGGEPTLAGLPFYRDLIKYERLYNRRGLPIYHAIQTNGILLDREWTGFLKTNGFLVGLSLDGTKESHDRYRLAPNGGGTFHRVLATAQRLQSGGVPFNLLTVVTADVARQAGKIYGFYGRSGFRYQQYIPCLDPLGEAPGGHPYSLTPRLYGEFLCALFDLWLRDLMRGEYVYIRYFENLLGLLAGEFPESCGLCGECSPQLLIEADGGVYPCDFYALDEWRLGNLCDDSFETIERRRQESGFIELSRRKDPKCAACRWYPLCRGGCRRECEPALDGRLGLNYFCESYEMFLSHALPGLREAARIRKR